MDKEGIQQKLDDELTEIQQKRLPVVSIHLIRELLNVLKKLDTDMIPVLDIFRFVIENLEDERARTIIIYKILIFYGIIGDQDILTTRQKYVLVKGTKHLQKRPFLKEKDKECINTLLKDCNIL
jgi:hypothetical protein